MEYSKQIKKLAAQFSVPVPTLAMADLVIAGYSEEDAYNIAYGFNAVQNIEKRDAQRQRIINDPNYQRILRERGQRETFSDELLDTESALKELLKQIQKMPNGKEKADLYAKYLESMRKTNAAPEEEDQRVQIYLPLKCKECELYVSYMKKPWKIDLSPKIPQ